MTDNTEIVLKELARLGYEVYGDGRPVLIFKGETNWVFHPESLKAFISQKLEEAHRAGVIKGLSPNGNITYEPPEEQAFRRGVEKGLSFVWFGAGMIVGMLIAAYFLLKA